MRAVGHLVGRSALLATAFLGACESGGSPAAPDARPSLTGVWRAANTGNRLWGDSIVLELTQTDTALVGRYEARGAAGRGTDGATSGATYGGAVSGWRRGAVTTLGLTYDPRAYGCTGAERSCFSLFLRFEGTLDAAGRLTGTLDDQLNRWPAAFARAPR